jgi:hypothetical protein
LNPQLLPLKCSYPFQAGEPLPLTVGSLLARALTCHFRETPDHYYLVRFPLASELSDLDLSPDFTLLQLSYNVAQPPS